MENAVYHPDDGKLERVFCLCLGTGRFLRATFVPLVVSKGDVVLLQPRGDAFCQKMDATGGKYDIETVNPDGSVKVDSVQLRGWAGAVSTPGGSGQVAVLDAARAGHFSGLRLLGVGLTEAGVEAPGSPAVSFLADLLHALFEGGCRALSVVCTDNLPGSGARLRAAVGRAAAGGAAA
eukprot:CAMPEP_0194674562 /NCGR_PEP_ID=MMETSP0295-20121207/7727_1 /TAXON_ID=39354 /ORGANISM="Heterosigma akashiwo, Strain CCMP2393" /LENGTH=177 /DNA_ID=CAMNT_0039558711 /DNA_START=88 /DNA_END=618 /DNA_ORIENTATION=+